LLRTVAALAVSKNFAIDGAQLDNGIINRLRLSEFLENPAAWKPPLGMYYMQGVGYRFWQKAARSRQASPSNANRFATKNP
jgi:hypothetical protein